MFDTSFRMLDDGQGNYFDPHTYTVAGDPVAAAAGVTSGTRYRRIYRRLEVTSDETSKYKTETVVGVSDVHPDYPKFWETTRYEIARRGLYRAISEGAGTLAEESGGWAPRWGVIRRQSSPAWATTCDKPVEVSDGAFDDVNDALACNSAGSDRLGVFAPTVAGASFAAKLARAGGGFRVPRGECHSKIGQSSKLFAGPHRRENPITRHRQTTQ